MKNSLFQLVSCLALFSVGASAAEWKVIYSKAYTFPFGVSASSPLTFPPGYGSAKVKVEYTGYNPCYIRAERIDVTLAQGGTVALLPDATGAFDLPSTDIRQAVIQARSSKWSKVECTETLYVQTAPAVSTMKYLGSLTLEPSWDEASFKLATPLKVTHFQLEVPAYCDVLAVSGAETMTEGAWDDAKLVDTHGRVFEVAGGMGMRISAIRLRLDPTLVGSCPINIYARLK